jgi:hypothetical protein
MGQLNGSTARSFILFHNTRVPNADSGDKKSDKLAPSFCEPAKKDREVDPTVLAHRAPGADRPNDSLGLPAGDAPGADRPND